MIAAYLAVFRDYRPFLTAGERGTIMIIAADRKIVGMIREKLPETKVLLLAIFPRGPRIAYDGTFDDGVKRMKIIRAVNSTAGRQIPGEFRALRTSE